MSMILSNQQARRLILHLQGLTRPPHKAFGPGELGDLITQLNGEAVKAENLCAPSAGLSALNG